VKAELLKAVKSCLHIQIHADISHVAWLQFITVGGGSVVNTYRDVKSRDWWSNVFMTDFDFHRHSFAFDICRSEISIFMAEWGRVGYRSPYTTPGECSGWGNCADEVTGRYERERNGETLQSAE
jgi:hypothetical protein